MKVFGSEKVVVVMKPGFVPPRGLPTRPNNTYMFTIGDLAVFEKQLAESQYDLGLDMFEHIPIVYDDSSNLSYGILHLLLSIYFHFILLLIFNICLSASY